LVRSAAGKPLRIAAFGGVLPTMTGIGRGRKMLVNTAARG
jgi:hypothetical protein